MTFNALDPDPVNDIPASRKTYTIGDDMLTEATAEYDYDASEWTYYAAQLMYDGHGSTRQLVTGSVGSTSIVDDFSYDGYGVLLQDKDNFPPNGTQMPGKVAPQATSLLYAGEHFDTDSQNYYLRARWYDSLSGRFNRMDPFTGSPQDPQSLHKYLYCHANPVMNIDPSGMFSLREMFCVAMLAGCISSIIAGEVVRFKGGAEEQIYEAQWKWFWIGAAAGAAIYGVAWGLSALWAWLVGGGTITAQQSAQYGYESLDDLKDAWRDQGFTISRFQHIHHFVSKAPANIQRFGAKAIHSLANTIPHDSPTHIGRLHSYTNSSTTTLNLTQYIGQHYSHLHQYIVKLSWEAQYAWGVAMYNYVQINGSMEGFNPVSHGLL